MTAARVAYVLRLDPVSVLEERHTLRRQVREASARVIVRDRSDAYERARNG